MSVPNRAQAEADARELAKRAREGGNEGSEAFRRLVSLLLHLTVLPQEAVVNRYRDMDGKYLIGGPRKTFDPIPLGQGQFFSISIQTYDDKSARGPADRPDWSVLKVSKARYQYQVAPDKKRWVFRYEYLRDPPDHHPCAHLHVRGQLKERACLPKKELLKNIHFPTERVSIEAIIRLLVDAFGLRCATPESVWRPTLLASEDAFREMQDTTRNPRQGEPVPRRKR